MSLAVKVLALGIGLSLTGCRLDTSLKTRCHQSSDCTVGYQCVDSVCTSAGCDGAACVPPCATGRRCGDQCIPDEAACNGTCGAGFALCEGRCIDPDYPPPELCDGRDNDCDGQIDEDLIEDCSTACGGGLRRCVAGHWDSSGCPPRPSDSDRAHCGPSCLVCPAPAKGHGKPWCEGGVCVLDCDTDRVPVGDRCDCAPDQVMCGDRCVAVGPGPTTTLCTWASSWDVDAPDTFCNLMRRDTLFDCSTIAGKNAECLRLRGSSIMGYNAHTFTGADLTRSVVTYHYFCCPSCSDLATLDPTCVPVEIPVGGYPCGLPP